MADGAKLFLSCNHGQEVSQSVGLQQDVTTWLKTMERDGCGRRRIGLFGEPWERPTSSNGRLSADMMIFLLAITKVSVFDTSLELHFIFYVDIVRSD